MIENEMAVAQADSKRARQRMADEYLSQASIIDLQIDEITEQIRTLRAMSIRITAVLSDMPKAGYVGNARFEDIINRITDKENELHDETSRLLDKKEEISLMIKNVSKEYYQSVLKYHYIDFLPWETVAEKMNVSTGHVYRLRREALEEFAKIMKR